jgi:hypothetical protein
MMTKKRVQFALLVGALAELMLVIPLFAVSHQLAGPFPMWVDILKNFQNPGARIILRLVHRESIQQLAARFRIAHGIYFAAELLSILIQTALFAVVTLALLYFLPPKRRARSTLASSAE